MWLLEYGFLFRGVEMSGENERFITSIVVVLVDCKMKMDSIDEISDG